MASADGLRGRRKLCQLQCPCVEFVLDSHALELCVLGLTSVWKTVLQILLERSENNAHFSVEGYGPGVVQTGKRREDRAAVLVTTRLSTESHRSGCKRDFKFGNRAQSAEACETPADRSGKGRKA